MKYRLGDLTVKNWNDWDRVPRDPITIGNFIIAGLGASTTSLAVIYAVGYLAVTAVTSWALSALMPKPEFSSFGSQGALVNAREATAAADFVYGEVRKGGTIAFYESTGTENKFLHQVIVLAGHEVNSIGDIYINDEVVPLDSNGFVTDDTWSITTAKRVVVGYTQGGGEAGNQPIYEYRDTVSSKIRIFKHDGSQTSTADTFANSATESLNSTLLAESELTGSDALDETFVGNGIAYLYVRYEYDKEVFANGLPLVTAKVQGKKVFDPRTGTTAYSNNAALCMRDFIASEYGLNDSAIDDVAFSVAANESDEDVRLSLVAEAGNLVVGQQYEIKTVGTTDFTAVGANSNTVGEVFVATGAGSGTGDAYRSEKRYTINGVVKASSPIGKVLGDMSTACAGTLFWGSGYWKLKVGAYSSPVKTLTLDDLRGPISMKTRTSMRDSFNGVTGTFNNADEDFITMDYPKVIAETSAGSFVVDQVYTITEVGTTDFTAIGASSNSLGVTFTATGAGSGTGKASAFLGEDGGDELSLDLPLPFTTSASAAQRLAKLTLFRAREQISISADFGLNAFDLEVGDIIAFDNERYGFDGKEFEVMGWKFASNQDAGDLRVTLTLQETSEAAFEWDAEEQEIISNNTNLPDPRFVPVPEYVGTPETQVIIQEDGTVNANVLIEWEVSDESAVSEYIVEWRLYDNPFVTYSLLTTNNKHTFQSLTIGESYIFIVWARNVLGVKSTAQVRSYTVTGDTTAPSAPIIQGATGSYEQITVEWENPTERDFDRVKVYSSASNNSATASLVGEVKGTSFTHSGITDQTTRYYWVKALDQTGNPSAFSGVASASALPPLNDGTSIVPVYADDASGANKSYTPDNRTFVLYHEYVDTKPPIGDITGTFVKFVGEDGATGDTIATGLVYYQTLQASAPSAPSAVSYDVATGSFSGLTAGWARTQPPVDITDTTVQEWSSQFQVTVDGVTSAQTISFSSPSGAIQVAADIQSDNYIAGSSGWSIKRDTGSAEFGAAAIRGTLSASQIQIDNVTLDTDGSGNLIIKDEGVGTDQIASGAITQSTSVGPSSFFLSAGTSDATTVLISNCTAGSEILVLFNYTAASATAGDVINLRSLQNGSASGGFGSATGIAVQDFLALPSAYIMRVTAVAGSNTVGVRIEAESGNSSTIVGAVYGLYALELKR